MVQKAEEVKTNSTKELSSSQKQRQQKQQDRTVEEAAPPPSSAATVLVEPSAEETETETGSADHEPNVDVESLEPILLASTKTTTSTRQGQQTVRRNSWKKRRQQRRGSGGCSSNNSNDNRDSSNTKNTSSTVKSPLRRLQQSILGSSTSNRPITIPENQPLLPLHQQDVVASYLRMTEPNTDITSNAADSRSSAQHYNGEITKEEQQKSRQQQINDLGGSGGGNSGEFSIPRRPRTMMQQQHHQVSSISSSSSSNLPPQPQSMRNYAGKSCRGLPLKSNFDVNNTVTGEENVTTSTTNNATTPPTKYMSNTTTNSSSSKPKLQERLNGGESTLQWTRQPATTTSTADKPSVKTPSRSSTISSNSAIAMPELTSSPTGKTSSSKKSSSLSRKVVKATVVKPARVVSRVFRGSSSKSSTTSNSNPPTPTGERRTATNTNGETDALLGRSSKPVLIPRGVGGGYGAMDLSGHSGHGTLLSLDGTVLETNTVSSSARRIDGPPGHPMSSQTIDWPVHSVESLTRHIVLVCAAYLVGAHHPEWLSQVTRVMEVGVTAWVTCIAILVLSFFQRQFPHLIGSNNAQPQYINASPEIQRSSKRATQRSYGTTPKQIFSPSNQQTPTCDGEAPNDAFANRGENDTSTEIEHALVDRVPSVNDLTGRSLASPQVAEHPSMNNFYVIDSSSGQRVQCNAATPFHLSNEWFEMDMLVMIRTPDADDSNAPKGTPANEMISTYMRGRQRRFEFQYQVKLKKKPVGKQIYFACELEETVKMGMVTKAFVGAAMAFIKTTNPTFHYSITGSKDKVGDGSYEKPHMSFTVEGSLDRLVVTKPGETPPQLGQPIYEDPESIKRRKKGTMTDWNTSDTYTLALWSSYVDFLDWQALNLPGIRPFSLSSVLASQPIYLTMYMIDEKRDSEKHYRKDLEEIVKIELSNGSVSEMGPLAKAWLQSTEDQIVQPSGASASTTAASTNIVPAVSRGRALSEDSNLVSRRSNARASLEDDNDNFDTILPTGRVGEDAGMDDIEEVDEDVETAAELGEGIYIRSGDSVVLRELIVNDEENIGDFSVGIGGGFAVLQEQDVSVVIEKVKSKKNKLIKSGDAVFFKLLQNKPGSDEVETLYLTIHRGWWLKWYVKTFCGLVFFSVLTEFSRSLLRFNLICFQGIIDAFKERVIYNLQS